MKHRGPDDHGFFIDKVQAVYLGHTRLSIIDLSSRAHQPMSNPQKNLWIVYNGELYNYRELRDDLSQRGHIFYSQSDTEVVLRAFEEWGAESLERLNGIFAFAIWDITQSTLFLARDPFGVKPLYYSFHGHIFSFASEIRALLAAGMVPQDIDMTALGDFLTFRFVPAPRTMFRHISKLCPSSTLEITASETVDIKDYALKASAAITLSDHDAIKQYQNLLECAIERQLMSDVPVGLFLSGGMDSSVIASIMHQKKAQDYYAFTVGCDADGQHNEIHDAAVVAKEFGFKHVTLQLGRRHFQEGLTETIRAMEEPIAYASIPLFYEVAKLASKYVKVALMGQGADELLGGYPRYRAESMEPYLGFLMRRPILPRLLQSLSSHENIQRSVRAYQHKDPCQRYYEIASIFDTGLKSSLLQKEARMAVNLYAPVDTVRGWHDKIGQRSGCGALMALDARMSLSDGLLLYADKLAMAHSLEVRVPFLDRALVQFLESLPARQRCSFWQLKRLHKKAAHKWLSRDVIHRPKKGFEAPLKCWMQGQMGEDLLDMLDDTRSFCGGFLNRSVVADMIYQHQHHRRDYQRHLYALWTLEMWGRQCTAQS